jgi:hypothetical protein
MLNKKNLNVCISKSAIKEETRKKGERKEQWLLVYTID